MEFDFSPRRSLLLAVLLGVFTLLGGFSEPKVSDDRETTPVHRAWFMCMVLFVGGAAAASVIEHTIGHMDPTNLRPAYIFIGVVLMVASVLWLKALKQGLAPPPRPLALHLAAGSGALLGCLYGTFSMSTEPDSFRLVVGVVGGGPSPGSSGRRK